MKYDAQIHRRIPPPPQPFRLARSVEIRRPNEVVFDFCLQGENLVSISKDRLEPVRETDSLVGKLNHVYPFRQWLGPLPLRWEMLIVEFEYGRRFVDEMLHGPMRYFRHTHLCEPQGDFTLYSDIIEYQPFLARLSQPLFVQRRMERTFEYRQRRMKELLEHHGHG